jgi:hypothetical protein
MKTFFTLLLFILSFKLLLGQDTIVKNNSETIIAKILEVNQTDIKYKKFNFQEGPTYVEKISGIQYVKYSNGTKEEFKSASPASDEYFQSPQKPKQETAVNTDYYNPNERMPLNSPKIQTYGSKYLYNERRIGEREMQGILLKTQDREIVRYVQGAKDAHLFSYAGFAAIPLGIGALVLMANQQTAEGALASAVLFSAAVTVPIVASGIYKKKRKAYNRKAIELYNQKY